MQEFAPASYMSLLIVTAAIKASSKSANRPPNDDEGPYMRVHPSP